jgi:cytochrome c556
MLGNSEGLHAEVAVGMTQTMKDALGSLAEEHAEGLVVNAIRKIIDNGQIALVKSGKLQPVHVTSRFYSFVAKKIQFPTQSDDDVRELIKRRVFWLSGKLGKSQPVEVAHPYDCQYVNASREKMLELAKQLAGQGQIKLEGDMASASDWLMQQEPAMQAAMQKGVDAGKAATKVTA